jgi:hypothetical protein
MMKSAALACLSLLIIASGCGSDGQPAEVVRPIAEWIVDRGGTLEVTGSSLPVAEKNRIPQGSFQILTINLNQTQVTDKELEQLKTLEGLVSLQLHSAPITDNGLDTIGQLTSLKRLELSNTRVTDKGLEKLTVLANLERLFLHNTPVTEEGVKSLRSRLRGCRILR